MQAEQLDYTSRSESMAFSIFTDNVTDDYKRTVLCLVYRAVLKNPDITTRTIHWILGKYINDKQHIDWALNCLSTNVFACVRRWTDEKKTVHYKTVPNSDFDSWFSGLTSSNPELLRFNVRKGNKGNK